MKPVIHTPDQTQPPITLTQAASDHILKHLSKQPECLGVRFSVTKTGCSGLAYVVEDVTTPVPNDITMPLNENITIFIDKKSYPFLKGMSVDYVKEGLNHKFVFENPNQTGACGCGESFTVS